jgi:hypothetical protein
MPEGYPLLGSEGGLTHTFEIPTDRFHALIKRSTRECSLRNDRDTQQAFAVRSAFQRGCLGELGIAATLFRTQEHVGQAGRQKVCRLPLGP